MIDNVKIMVVDPDPLIRHFIVDVLEFSVNRKVNGFASGIEALDHIEQHGGVDLLLCASRIPGISGEKLVESVKSRWPATICVMISEPSAGRDNTLDRIIDTRLKKPFDTRELFDIVQRFVVDADKQDSAVSR